MSFNGSGVFLINSSGQPVVANTLITAAVFNAFTEDVATGLSTTICKDGQTTITANLPMSGFRHTGVGNASARNDYAALGQVQDGAGIYVATVGGTADAITLTPSPAITAYAAGQSFRWIASGANTTAVTLQVSGLASPKAVTKNGASALVANDIPSGALVEATYDGTQFQLTAVVADKLPLSGGNLTGLVADANVSVAAHATTMNPWVAGYITLTGAAVTFTALTAAPQAGAEVELYMNAAHVFTDGAVFEVDGNANYTATIGDRVVMRAKSTTVFTVQPIKEDGTAVVASGAPFIDSTAIIKGSADATKLVAIEADTNVPTGTTVTLTAPAYSQPVGGITHTAGQATTSGTSIDFTGIPAGVRRINLVFNGVSTNGVSNFLIQLGDAGGIENTDYTSSAELGGTGATSTAGFIVRNLQAASPHSGFFTLINYGPGDGISWIGQAVIRPTDSSGTGGSSAGGKTTSAVIDRIRLTTVNGTDAFDAGAVSLTYE